jgi:hypothetical protein
LWKSVEVHTIHDCRHTYAVCRSFEPDGEEKGTTEHISSQLGHANEAVMVVCKALSPVRRRQLLAEAEKLRPVSRSA